MPKSGQTKCNKEYKKRYYARTAFAFHSRRRYTDYDDQEILTSKETDTELAAKLGRSVMSIQTRRWRLIREPK